MATGMGGIAIESEIELEISNHLIDAQNGTGLVSSKDVTLYLCKISAGVESLVAPDFTSDTYAITPVAS